MNEPADTGVSSGKEDW